LRLGAAHDQKPGLTPFGCEKTHKLNAVGLRHCEVHADQVRRFTPHMLLENLDVRSRDHVITAGFGNALDQCGDRRLVVDNKERSAFHIRWSKPRLGAPQALPRKFTSDAVTPQVAAKMTRLRLLNLFIRLASA
jgi:hypothetical protein